MGDTLKVDRDDLITGGLYKDTVDNIVKGIVEAQEKMLAEKIAANSVIIDNKYIKVKQFLWSNGFGLFQSPFMIGGLKARFADLPNDYAFLVYRNDNDDSPSRSDLEKEIAELKEKLNKIKELLGE